MVIPRFVVKRVRSASIPDAFSQWLDFPRQGNNNSFQYARRQWNVVDDPLLRYKYLNEFDKVMNHTEERYGWLHAEPAYVSLKHEVDKVIVYERAGLLFVFNFHPTNSFSDYRVGVEEAGEYTIVLSSDEKRFGGFDNIQTNASFFTTPMEWNNRKNWMQVCAASLLDCLSLMPIVVSRRCTSRQERASSSRKPRRCKGQARCRIFIPCQWVWTLDQAVY